MKQGTPVACLLAATVLLAGCGSASDTAGSAAPNSAAASSVAASTAASSGGSTSGGTTSSAASSSATSSSLSSSSSAVSSPDDTTSSAASSPAGTGGATGDVDAETVAWFDTFCTGIAVFADLGENEPDSPEELGQQLTTVGTSFTDTAADLKTLPPPTIEGGNELAQQLIGNMEEAGPVFTDFGQRVAQIDASDQVAGEQFQKDFEAAVSDLDIATFEPNAAARSAVADIPSCDVLGT